MKIIPLLENENVFIYKFYTTVGRNNPPRAAEILDMEPDESETFRSAVNDYSRFSKLRIIKRTAKLVVFSSVVVTQNRIGAKRSLYVISRRDLTAEQKKYFKEYTMAIANGDRSLLDDGL